MYLRLGEPRRRLAQRRYNLQMVQDGGDRPELLTRGTGALLQGPANLLADTGDR